MNLQRQLFTPHTQGKEATTELLKRGPFEHWSVERNCTVASANMVIVHGAKAGTSKTSFTPAPLAMVYRFVTNTLY